MEKKQLNETLQELHTSLSQVEELDESTREAMRALTADLERILGESSPSSDDLQTARDHLQAMLLRFETDHPQLTGILGRVANALANIGI